MIISKALIRLPEHEVSVQIEDTGRIVLFKQRAGTKQCDFAVFQSGQGVEASEWVHESLPSVHYQITTAEGEQLL